MIETRIEYRAGSPAYEGWGSPSTTKYAHYFVDGVSLCGRWRQTGELKANHQRTRTPYDCVGCLHEIIKRLQSLLETEQRARWGAEQDICHWRERAEDLERQRMALIAEAEWLRLQDEQPAQAREVTTGAGEMEER